MTELARIEDAPALLNVETGELLEPTVDNAAAVLLAARNMEERLREIKQETTAYIVAEAERRGTKTLHGETETLKVTGGPADEYDALVLEDLLRSAGCPEDRIRAAIVEEITYKVNKSVLKQLAGANPNYKAAVELARREVEKPYYASVGARRSN